MSWGKLSMNIELYNIDSLFYQQILTEKLLKATVNLKVS